MLKPIKNTETYQHICAGCHADRDMKIYLHDVHAYAMVGTIHVGIRFCPFCGVNPDTENRS